MKRFSTFLLIAAIGTACNNPAADGDDAASEATPAREEMTTTDEKSTEPREVKAEEVELTLRTTGEQMNTMAYEPKKLEVPTGATVKLTLINEASSAAMIHNAVFIVAGKQDEVIEAGLEAGPDAEYIPESEHIIAATGLAQPGETVELTFTAPKKKGTYQYICTYPGHKDMKGILSVK